MRHCSCLLSCSLLILMLPGCALLDGFLGTGLKGDPLNVVSSMPTQAATGITYSARTITLSFDQDIDADDIRGSITISADIARSPDFTLEAQGKDLRVKLQDIQEFETRYTLRIEKGTPSINDHVLQDDFELQFTTAPVFEEWYYTLHTLFLGQRQLLQSSEPPEPLRMKTREEGLSTQHWQFIPATIGYYQLAPRGFSRRSVEGADGAIPAFSTEYGRSTGEQWTIVDSGIENLWTLQNLHLLGVRALESGDGTDGLLPFMAPLSKEPNTTFSGQLWTLTRVEQAF